MSVELILKEIFLIVFTLYLLFIVYISYKLCELKSEIKGLKLMWNITKFPTQEEIGEALFKTLKIFEDICVAEQIPLFYTDECINVDGTLAGGVYSYKTNLAGDWFYATRIRIHKDRYKAMTLAHELGHHFSLKLNNDGTEDSADRYIKTLFELHIPKEIQETLALEIKVWSTPQSEKIKQAA